MHEDKSGGFMRMCVELGDATMGRPAGMADTDRTGGRVIPDDLLQVLQFAHGFTDHQLPVVDDGDSRRIIAAIFQTFQPLDQNRDRIVPADIADNSAHP